MNYSRKWFWAFVGPILLVFMVVVIIPMITGFFYSFTDWNGISNKINWVAFKNYIKIFTEDEDFLNSFLFTAKFALVSLITINVTGFGLAILMTRGLKGTNFFRSIFFMPNMIGGLILGFIWQFIFTKVFDSLGTILNLDFLKGWLSDPSTGFWGLVILMTWQMAGYMMVIYISAIENIPKSVIEAARIDGANALQRLRYIIIPLVMPAFTVGLFLTLSNSFKLYDQNLSLTAGGPHGSTQMLAMNIYNTAFVFDKFGLAQAKAIVFLITVAAITLIQVYYGKKREVEM